jgi:predicted secreted hydrolase
VHRHDERLTRGAIGLAGQPRQPFRVWLENWSLTGGDGGAFPWSITLPAGDFSLELTLEPLRDPVLQGDGGLSQKSDEPGNASYYYSITRLATAGTVRSDGEAVAVTGVSWLDREWSTSALGEEQAGWDWFSLQLADGSDLMFYRLRRRDGSTDRHSAGTLLRPDGRRHALDADAVTQDPRRWWRAPDGRRYPVAWDVAIPGENLRLRVKAMVDAQEMTTAVRYWEGAVAVTDAETGEPRGRGYLEMTGY